MIPGIRARKPPVTRSLHLRPAAPALVERSLPANRLPASSLPTLEGAVAAAVGGVPFYCRDILEARETQRSRVASAARPAPPRCVRLSSRASYTSVLLALSAAPWRWARTSALRKAAKREPRRKCKWRLSCLSAFLGPVRVGGRVLGRGVGRMARMPIGLSLPCWVGKFPTAAWQLRVLRRGGPLSFPWLFGPVRAPLSRLAPATRSWRVPCCGLTGLVISTGNGYLSKSWS